MHYGLTHYIWDDWKSDGKALREKPSDEFKDFPDLFRYTCMFEPRYFNLSEMQERKGRMNRIVGMSNSGLG